MKSFFKLWENVDIDVRFSNYTLLCELPKIQRADHANLVSLELEKSLI